MRRLASHFLIAPDLLSKNGVIEINNQKLIRIFSLNEEIESAAWFPGILILSSHQIDVTKINSEMINAIGENISSFIADYLSPTIVGEDVYVYHISSVDLSSFSITKESKITELEC